MRSRSQILTGCGALMKRIPITVHLSEFISFAGALCFNYPFYPVGFFVEGRDICHWSPLS
jgi:hypothetical protein